MTLVLPSVRQVYWAPWPVQRRDFVMLLNKARLSDGTVILFGKSVRHAACPEKAKHVRAEILIGGWLIVPCDADGKKVPLDQATHTHLTFVACTDLKGSIPSMVKTQLDRKQPALINAVKPLLAKRVADLAAMKDRAEAEKIHQQLKHVVDCLPIYSEKDLAEAKGATAN